MDNKAENLAKVILANMGLECRGKKAEEEIIIPENAIFQAVYFPTSIRDLEFFDQIFGQDNSQNLEAILEGTMTYLYIKNEIQDHAFLIKIENKIIDVYLEKPFVKLNDEEISFLNAFAKINSFKLSEIMSDEIFSRYC